jgi:hypothetical protein
MLSDENVWSGLTLSSKSHRARMNSSMGRCSDKSQDIMFVQDTWD